MRRISHFVAAVLIALHTTAGAAVISFTTDPFEGTDAPTTPGRQIVGNELFTSFDVANDQFAFNPAAFGIDSLVFFSGLAANLPDGGVNVIVLHDVGPPMLAGLAANLIADEITAAGPGFFVYFNTGLGVVRLVYSTDLSDNTADLKVLARLTNLTTADALSTFTAANFILLDRPVAVAEPAALALLGLGFAGLAVARRRRRR